MTRARNALAEIADIPASELDPEGEEAVVLLDLAGLAAHESGDRRNAPLLGHLVGRTRHGADLSALAAAVRAAANSTDKAAPHQSRAA
jgi:hypothetical protein